MVMKALVWKYYFWVILAFDMVSFVLPFDRRVWEIVETAFFFVALVGLFGFCWKRRIIARVFWQVFFAAFMCWILVYFTIIRSQAMPASLASIPTPTLIMFAIVVGALHVPLAAGLYLYAFKKGIWEIE
jgi:hypothetical protein